MLKLKKIHILGFKSFCDRTELTVPGTGIAVVVGPNGSYLTAWCHLRQEDRVFRMDRISKAEPTATRPQRPPSSGDLKVDGYETKLPAAALRPEDLFPTPT